MEERGLKESLRKREKELRQVNRHTAERAKQRLEVVPAAVATGFGCPGERHN